MLGTCSLAVLPQLKDDKTVLLHNEIKTDALENHCMSPLLTYFSRCRNMARSNFMFYQTGYAEHFLLHAGDFLSNLVIIWISRRTLLHEVSKFNLPVYSQIIKIIQ